MLALRLRPSVPRPELLQEPPDPPPEPHAPSPSPCHSVASAPSPKGQQHHLGGPLGWLGGLAAGTSGATWLARVCMRRACTCAALPLCLISFSPVFRQIRCWSGTATAGELDGRRGKSRALPTPLCMHHRTIEACLDCDALARAAFVA